MTPRRIARVAAAPLPELLTLKQVAALLGLSLRTLMTMRAAGRLRVLRFGRAVRVEPAEVERLIREARS